jgi:hypothetical protein
MRIAVALGIVTLSGCAATVPPVVTVACPPVRSYTLAQEQQLGAAVQALPPDSPLIPAMEDYGAMRKVARACK